jgi:hypothetical protein
MFEAMLNIVHAALMDFAVRHDTLFSLLLVAPAVIAYFFSYAIVRHRGWSAPVFMRGRAAVSTGLLALLLTVSGLSALPRMLRAGSIDTMCATIPFMTLVLGACWGVFAANIMAWWRTRPRAH